MKMDFIGLNPATKYTISIMATLADESIEDGYYSQTAKITVGTTAFAAPKGLKVALDPTSKTDTIKVSWNQSPSTEISGYIISVFRPVKKEDGDWNYGEEAGEFFVLKFDEDGNLGGDLSVDTITVGKSTAWQVTIAGLDPDTSYNVKIYAFADGEVFREREFGEPEEPKENAAPKFELRDMYDKYGYSVISLAAKGGIRTAKELLGKSPLPAKSEDSTAEFPARVDLSIGTNGIAYYNREDKEHYDVAVGAVMNASYFGEHGVGIIGLPKSENNAYGIFTQMEDGDELLLDLLAKTELK
jgi:hypothetical protein